MNRATTSAVSMPSTILSATRLWTNQLLGLVDGAHAALAQHANEPVRTEAVGHISRNQRMKQRAECDLLGSRMRREESLDPRPEKGITAAGVFQMRFPLCRRQVETGMKELLLANVIVMSVAHYSSSVAPEHRRLGRIRRSCARTATRAPVRFTVASERPVAAIPSVIPRRIAVRRPA